MKVHVTELIVGDRLAQHIYNDAGILIFPAETMIEEVHIQSLISHHVDEVAIMHRHVDEIGQLIPTAMRITKNVSPHFHEALDSFKDIYILAQADESIDESYIDADLQPLLNSLLEERDVITLLIQLNSRDDYTFQHSVHVGIIAYFIAIWLGKSEEEAYTIAKAGYLHDIGKSKISDELLTRPSKLTDEEFKLIKQHPIDGHEIILKITGSSIIAKAALQHHERLDGSGYPHGIKDEDIHEYARIIAIADIYSAMVSSRSYQKKRDFLTVLKELHHLSFSKIDPTITQVFIKNMIPNFIGKKVTLTSGESGMIVMNNPSDFFHPLIKIDDEFIDLSENRDIEIEMIYI